MSFIRDSAGWQCWQCHPHDDDLRSSNGIGKALRTSGAMVWRTMQFKLLRVVCVRSVCGCVCFAAFEVHTHTVAARNEPIRQAATAVFEAPEGVCVGCGLERTDKDYDWVRA